MQVLTLIVLVLLLCAAAVTLWLDARQRRIDRQVATWLDRRGRSALRLAEGLIAFARRGNVATRSAHENGSRASFTEFRAVRGAGAGSHDNRSAELACHMTDCAASFSRRGV